MRRLPQRITTPTAKAPSPKVSESPPMKTAAMPKMNPIARLGKYAHKKK